MVVLVGLILFAVAITSLFGFLIYMPIKNRLISRGKHTPVLAKKVNLFFIVYVLVNAIIFYNVFTFHPPANKVLEKATGIQFPNDFKVIKEEYHDMFQGYDLQFELILKRESMEQYVNYIKKSNNFLRFSNGMQGIWEKTDYGYGFNRQDVNERRLYKIRLDTTNMTVIYQESQ